MKRLILIIILCLSCVVYSQEDKELQLAQKRANNYVYEGNDLADEDFVAAEMAYRKALSSQSDNIAGLYNLGNSYYNNGNLDEALYRHQQTAKLSTSKSEKHKAFHNMGNIFMKNKQCKLAVEAYKNALRNNPTDDETRYNLVLAQKCAEEQKNDDKQDKNQDQENNEKQDQNQDNQQEQNKENEENEDQQNEDKKEDEQNKENQNEDESNKDEGEKEGQDGKNDDEKNSEEDKEDKSEGDESDKNKEEDEERKKDGNFDNEGDDSQGKRGQQQLSPQQIRSLLEAMNNQEKKVQEKVKEEKMKEAKGQRVYSEKDW